jgi:hypothetical protein
MGTATSVPLKLEDSVLTLPFSFQQNLSFLFFGDREEARLPYQAFV